MIGLICLLSVVFLHYPQRTRWFLAESENWNEFFIMQPKKAKGNEKKMGAVTTYEGIATSASFASYSASFRSSAVRWGSRVQIRARPSEQAVTMSPLGIAATHQTVFGCTSVCLQFPSGHPHTKDVNHQNIII